MAKKGREWEDSSIACCGLFHVLSVFSVPENPAIGQEWCLLLPLCSGWLSQAQGMARSPSPHQLLYRQREITPKGTGRVKTETPTCW